MTWQIAVAVVVGLLFFIFVWPGPQMRREGLELRAKREAAEKKAAEDLERFRKYHFVIRVRERDGRRVFFESVLIGRFLRNDIAVERLTNEEDECIGRDDFSKLKEDCLIIVGVSWQQAIKHEGHRWDDPESGASGWMPAHTEHVTHCDYRLLRKKGDKTELVAAGVASKGDSVFDGGPESLAATILSNLAKSVKD